ncbi:MAG: hypothetical protein HY840_02090 [Bacteroidetes bacterium]|nr:hypothetical protein [Bacteroidota bacterium]
MNKKFKEYSFNEWMCLSFDDQRDIINHYWDPFSPKKGEDTRKEILIAFEKALKENFNFLNLDILDFMQKQYLSYLKTVRRACLLIFQD